MVSLFKEANPFSKRIPSIDISSLLPFRMTLGALKRWLKCQTRKFRDGLYRKCQVRIFLSYPVSFCALGRRAIFATTEQMIDSLQHFS